MAPIALGVIAGAAAFFGAAFFGAAFLLAATFFLGAAFLRTAFRAGFLRAGIASSLRARPPTRRDRLLRLGVPANADAISKPHGSCRIPSVRRKGVGARPG